jgi:hypothetical protein
MRQKGQEEKATGKAGLLDFLYQDKSKIASFYAQVFSGNIVAITKHEENSKAKEVRYGGKVAIAEASRQTQEQSSTQVSTQIDPHDYSSLLLLSALDLAPSDQVEPEMIGKMVLLEGTLRIRNYVALKTMFPIVLKAGLVDSQLGTASLRAPNMSEKKQKEQARTLIGSLFDIIPSGLEMEVIDAQGRSIVGPLKPEYLDQSPDDILRTYGETLGGEWSVLGILGFQKQRPAVPGHLLRQTVDDIGRTIRALYAPADEYIITPVLIYRQISS